MFRDRKDAGVQLAEKLMHYRFAKDLLVLALPRGGVVTGFEVARRLGAPLDVLLVRKIGVPWQPELAAGLRNRNRGIESGRGEDFRTFRGIP